MATPVRPITIDLSSCKKQTTGCRFSRAACAIVEKETDDGLS